MSDQVVGFKYENQLTHYDTLPFLASYRKRAAGLFALWFLLQPALLLVLPLENIANGIVVAVMQWILFLPLSPMIYKGYRGAMFISMIIWTLHMCSVMGVGSDLMEGLPEQRDLGTTVGLVGLGLMAWGLTWIYGAYKVENIRKKRAWEASKK